MVWIMAGGLYALPQGLGHHPVYLQLRDAISGSMAGAPISKAVQRKLMDCCVAEGVSNASVPGSAKGVSRQVTG